MWKDNSCYMDCSLLCLLLPKCAFVDMLLTKPLRSSLAMSIQRELREIVRSIRGGGNAMNCARLRALLPSSFTGSQMGDPGEFIGYILDMCEGDVAEKTVVTCTKKGASVVDVSRSKNTNFSVIQLVPADIRDKGTDTSTALTECSSNPMENGMRSYQQITVDKTPYLIYNAVRCVQGKINYGRIHPNHAVRLKSGGVLDIVGVVLYVHPAHFVCLVKYDQVWYYYDGLQGPQLQRVGTWQEVKVKFPVDTNGVLYCYLPRE